MSDSRLFLRGVPCLALLATSLLGACGLTGDLYLPDDSAPTETPSVSEDAEAEDEDEADKE